MGIYGGGAAETENDLQYMQEVIYKVKEGFDGSQNHLSEFIQQVFADLAPDQNQEEPVSNEDYEALLCEANEVQRSFKKVIDIASKLLLITHLFLVFLLHRSQILNNENKALIESNSQYQFETHSLKSMIDSLQDSLREEQSRNSYQAQAMKA